MKFRAESRFFTAWDLFDNVIAIEGMGTEMSYLVLGEKRAVLIDGMTGVGSLRSFVRELTDIPVRLVVTHGHLDHFGGAFEYGECFIHPDDIALAMSELQADEETRLNFCLMESPFANRRIVPVLSDVVPQCAVRTYPIHEGDVFDLGGTELEVISVPGHTFGSVVLLDRNNRAVYSGDACNQNTPLDLPGSASIEEYLAALKHFKTFQQEFDAMYCGHVIDVTYDRAGLSRVPDPKLPVRGIDDGIALAEAILQRRDDAVPLDGKGRFSGRRWREGSAVPADGSWCNIIYDVHRLHRRPPTPITDGPNFER